jgi:hypothetical protein
MHNPSRQKLAAATSMVPRPVLLALALGTLTVAVAGQASAQEACGETTCPRGFTCQAVPTPCPLIACLDGQSCPVCTPQTSYVCAPADCASDSDCGAEMVCAGFESTQCPTTPPTPACAPNTDCSAPETKTPANWSTTCTTTTSHQCAPRWQLPCRVSADCGPGFTCQEQQSCGCSGGGATGAGTTTPSSTPPAATGDPTPPDCTCTGTGTSACVAIPEVCATDASCLPGWTCQAVPSASGCSVSSDGQRSCDTPPDPPKNCAPPYSGIATSGGRGTAVGSSAPSTPNEGGAKAVDTAAPVGGCMAAGIGRDTSNPGSLLVLALIAAAWLPTMIRRRRARRSA